jgi:conjugative relaxase-like TrwC/TraI family protein
VLTLPNLIGEYKHIIKLKKMKALKGNIKALSIHFKEATGTELIESYYTEYNKSPIICMTVNDNGISLATNKSAYQNMLKFKDLQSGEQLARLKENSTLGYETTLTSCKSVSVLYSATNNDEIKQAIIGAVEQASQETIKLIKREAVIRRGPKGEQTTETPAEIYAAIATHSTNRNSEPHLHTHLHIGGIAKTDDNKYYHLFGYKQSAMQGIVNQTYLTAFNNNIELKQTLYKYGYTFENGEIKELEPYNDYFSTRRKEIINAYSKINEKYGEARTKKTLKKYIDLAWNITRKNKKITFNHAEYKQHIQQQLNNIGYKKPRKPLIKTQLKPCKDSFLKELNLQEKGKFLVNSKNTIADTFSNLDLKTFIMKECETITAPKGHYFTDKQQKYIYQTIKNQATKNIKCLTSDIIVFTEAEKRGVGLLTTEKIYQREYEIGKNILQLRGQNKLGLTLGYAGSGKTTAIQSRVKSGEKIQVLAFMNTVANDYKDTGIQAETIRKFLLKNNDLTNIDTLIIDEASMVNRDDFCEILEIANKHNKRIELWGDDKQLQAIGTGNIIGTTKEYIEPNYMSETYRFDNKKYGEFTKKLHDQKLNFKDIKTAYAGDDNVVGVFAESLTLLNSKKENKNSNFGIVKDNDLCLEINALVEQNLLKKGVVDKKEIATLKYSSQINENERIIRKDKIACHKGSIVEIRANNAKFGVFNRERYVIEKEYDKKITLAKVSNQNEKRYIPKSWFINNACLGYAGTTYSAQGKTVDNCLTLIDKNTNAYELYVGLTRGKSDNYLFVKTDDINNKNTVIKKALENIPKPKGGFIWEKEMIEKNNQVKNANNEQTANNANNSTIANNDQIQTSASISYADIQNGALSSNEYNSDLEIARRHEIERQQNNNNRGMHM